MTDVIQSTWEMFAAAAPYFLLGLCIAGLMHGLLRRETIAQYLGAANLRSIALAALIGVPLPLCSCGVLPAALGLRRSGASKSATLAFLISTPESGVDSIAVTYALLGPLMAVLRPLAAFTTAFVAGVAELIFGEKKSQATTPINPAVDAPTPARTDIFGGLRYAFITLLGDITPTFLIGIFLSGVISVLVPASVVEQYLGSSLTAKFVMLAIGIPLYICAAASTPIAAALMFKGMSAGTALVFLLAGPATNLSSLPVLTRELGLRSVAWYLASIAVTTLCFGIAVDYFFPSFAAQLAPLASPHHHDATSLLHQSAAIILLALMGWASVVRRRKKSS